MSETLSKELTHECVLVMKENVKRISICLAELSYEEIWQRPNSQLSSIGNLILHLCGNIGQYVLSSLGGKPDQRKRDDEFAATGGYTADKLLALIDDTVNRAATVMQELPEAELLRKRMVQGFNISGVGIVVHVTEHLSYHTAQIALHTKLLKKKDLGFYAGLNLNIPNE
ncbi:MAG: DUF1572 family protein [Flavipsychrobacter sp.]|nr:DUF1572 family protein [Flavipsychrobacter sp.]